MAIQPIDLSTMYSQMNNVAKNVAHQQQGVQLAQAMQETSVIQQNKELSSQVHKAADNQTETNQVKADQGGSSGGQSAGGNKKNNEEEKETPSVTEIRESYLGQHIDISG
jgi:hypothetical protein